MKSNACSKLPLAIPSGNDSDTPIVIAMINQKGGCGKSSSCFHLAGGLVASGMKVLLVDADPQGSLSQGFFGSEEIECLPRERTLAALFDTEVYTAAESLIEPTSVEGISVVRANQLLATFNVPDPERTGMMQFVLQEFLADAHGFDIVLIDCPPNLYLCSWNAMLAAQYVVIPVPPEDFGTQGLRAVHQAVDHARQLNPDIRRLGHLVTRHDKRLLVHRAYEARLRSHYGDLVLSTVIPEAAAFKVALSARRPVEFTEPRSAAAQSTRELTSEIIERISERTKKQKRKVA